MAERREGCSVVERRERDMLWLRGGRGKFMGDPRVGRMGGVENVEGRGWAGGPVGIIYIYKCIRTRCSYLDKFYIYTYIGPRPRLHIQRGGLWHADENAGLHQRALGS